MLPLGFSGAQFTLLGLSSLIAITTSNLNLLPSCGAPITLLIETWQMLMQARSSHCARG